MEPHIPITSRNRCSLLIALLFFSHAPLVFGESSQRHTSQTTVEKTAAAPDEGIRFSCKSGQLADIESQMGGYLSSLGIPDDWLVKKSDRSRGLLIYTLNTPMENADTLNLGAIGLEDDIVSLPAKKGIEKKIRTVSKKEILLTLLQHGRLTEFAGSACDINALKDHVGIRQNIVAWAENLNWVWPDGNTAKWNGKYWVRGTPRPGVPLHVALNDVFFNQQRYAIGCYTATKLVIIQGVLDYYRRIKKDPAQLKLLEKRLSLDKQPLVDIEPGKMWDFEKNFDPQERNRPGKLLKIIHSVPARNHIPGDWVYFINTDPVSREKTGYEGSNPIYLGRNKFADYFNDNDHAYTYQQKVDEVYQWRNGVFSRSRDVAKIQPLTPQDIDRLGAPPSTGGVLHDIRVIPYYFGYEALPVLVSSP
jgi:hypothetical protein